MKAILLISLFCSIFSFNLRHAKQEYDSYVMAVQWSNGYCKVNKCGNKADNVEKNTMTIHGLWPSLKSGKMLQPCTSGVKIKEDGSDLIKDMKKYWPSFSKANTAFWEHEYNKHGYCMVEEKHWSGYQDYFQNVIELFLKTYKDLIIRAFDVPKKKIIEVSLDSMRKALNKIIPGVVFKMTCNKKYLTEMYFYLEKDLETPSENSAVPASCKSAQILFK